ncbi:MAG: hypothetical protein V4714_11040 [Bacteroidota bacterium]
MLKPILQILHVFFCCFFCLSYASYAQIRDLKISGDTFKKDLPSKGAIDSTHVHMLKQSYEGLKKNLQKRSPLDSIKIGEKVKIAYQQQSKSIRNQAKSLYKKRLNVLKNLYQTDSASLRAFKLPTPIKFNSGQASLVQQISQREGAYPIKNAPPTFTRFVFNGSVLAFGIPLRVNALLSTEQSNLRQPMNRIGVDFDRQQWQKKLKNRLDNQIHELEKVAQSDGLKDLDKIYALEDLSKISTKGWDEFNSIKQGKMSDALENQIKKSAFADSLQKLSAGWSKKAQRKLESVQDSLFQVYRTKKDKRLSQWKDKTSSSTDTILTTKDRKAMKKTNKKVKKYLETNRIKPEQYQKLKHFRDSLMRSDPERLIAYEKIKMLKKIEEKGLLKSLAELKQFNLLSLSERWLGQVKSFGIGTTYPFYSKYTLRNVPVTGIHAEWQPGLFHLAFIASKNLSIIPTKNTYARDLTAGQLGIGRKEDNHFYFTFLHGKDDKRSLPMDTLINNFQDTSFYQKPRENYLVGTEFKLQLKEWLSTEGEFVHSITAMNTLNREIHGNEVKSSLFKSTTDTNHIQAGKAYALKLNAQLTTATKITLSSEYINAGFYSLGAPFLRNNLMGMELKLDHSFLKHQITISPKYGRWKNTDADSVKANMPVTSYGLRLKTSFKKLPSLMLDYLSYRTQANNFTNITEAITLNAGHNYTLGNVKNQSTLSISAQSSYFQKGEQLKKHSVRNILLNHVASFDFPVQLSGQASLLKIDTGQKLENWTIIGGSIAYTFRGNWQSSIGFTEGSEPGAGFGNTQTIRGKKQSRFVESKVAMGRFCTLQMRVESNLFETGEMLRDYKEMRGTFTLSSHF